jgi:hypothetical protein
MSIKICVLFIPVFQIFFEGGGRPCKEVSHQGPALPCYATDSELYVLCGTGKCVPEKSGRGVRVGGSLPTPNAAYLLTSSPLPAHIRAVSSPGQCVHNLLLY